VVGGKGIDNAPKDAKVDDFLSWLDENEDGLGVEMERGNGSSSKSSGSSSNAAFPTKQARMGSTPTEDDFIGYGEDATALLPFLSLVFGDARAPSCLVMPILHACKLPPKKIYKRRPLSADWAKH
jgi:hypothetical protein